MTLRFALNQTSRIIPLGVLDSRYGRYYIVKYWSLNSTTRTMIQKLFLVWNLNKKNNRHRQLTADSSF